ncbi:HPr kinase/phosphorylase [Tritonibacter scottomollicae]|nr:HPr kinase/phosphatase C-terminal domain-containing protein [Tritonibacter scottomollicae]
MVTGASAGTVLHASCVALEGRGVLISGQSGSGKSALALELMARGAVLVADDRTEIRRAGTRLLAKAPAPICGLIEARGVGILRADVVAEVQLHVIVDMSQLETDRLPRHVRQQVLGVSLPSLKRAEGDHFAAALIQYLKGGAIDPDGNRTPL